VANNNEDITLDINSPRYRKARRKRLTERLEVMRERVNLLEIELAQYTSDFFRVCIFGSARIQENDEYYKLTEEIAFLMGQEGIDVLTGGGRGLMEAAMKGVRSGREKSGSRSKSFGVTIELNRFEPPSEHIDIKYHHRRFSSRLDDFMRLSNAIVVTPGGIGTLLELFFSWQLLQLNHISDRPLILVGREFWHGLIVWFDQFLLDRNLVSPGDKRWLHVVDTPQEVHEIVMVEYQRFLEVQAAKGEVKLED
jgi:uncharacterized protein (TIGR00730 family)